MQQLSPSGGYSTAVANCGLLAKVYATQIPCGDDDLLQPVVRVKGRLRRRFLLSWHSKRLENLCHKLNLLVAGALRKRV